MILIALALSAATPPPGWDIGNAFAKDVCTESDALRSDRACYRAWLRYEREGPRMRTIPADDPCDYRYSRATHGEFYSDDHPYGPMPGCRRP